MDRMQIRQPKKRYTSRKDILGHCNLAQPKKKISGARGFEIDKLFSKKKTKWDSSSALDDRHSDYKAPSKEGAAECVKLANSWLTGKR